jgi:hypothetical protein
VMSSNKNYLQVLLKNSQYRLNADFDTLIAIHFLKVDANLNNHLRFEIKKRKKAYLALKLKRCIIIFLNRS